MTERDISVAKIKFALFAIMAVVDALLLWKMSA
jgi:hypothetical protein